MAGLVDSKKGRKFALVTGGILLTADAFGLDLAMSPDFAIGVPYALVVVLGIWWPDRSYIMTAAVVGSTLCLLGFYFSFLSGQLWVGAFDRGFAIFVILMVTVLCLFHHKLKIKKLELQRLNDHIGKICSEGMTGRDEYFLYKLILDSLLSFTQSRFGFIYGVMQDQEGKPFLEKKAGPAWNSLLEKPLPSPEGEVYNMAPLLDEVLHTGKPLLMKDVSSDLRSGPMSVKYPPMESFMGLPFYHEGRLLGVVGVANRTGGYDESRMENMAPFLSACAIRLHAFKIGPEQPGMEKTLKEQECKFAALSEGQGKGEEEFNRLGESLNRLQEEKEKTEECLRGKDAQIQKAEEERNRTASALWEKEQRLTNVLDDLNLLENDLKENVESKDRMEKDLEQVQDQCHDKDDKLEAMATSLDKNRAALEEKERLVEWLEYKAAEGESQLQLAKNTLKYRERLLGEIEKQIHESFKGKSEADSPNEMEQNSPERKKNQKKPIEWDLVRQRQGLQENEDRQVERSAPGVDLGPKAEKQNGKNSPLEKEFDDDGQKVKNRFRRYTRELERSNEDLREFAAIASHDLQEPIRKIIGFGRRLKKDCSSHLDDRGRDYLERMERSTQQMQEFVDDLLQYSKITISSPLFQRVDLKEVISHVLIVLESHVEPSRPLVQVGSMPVIEGDRMQMAQLFQNLISNAIKFHKKGESSVVRINHRSLENGFHEIRVEDQGIGFDEKHLDQIFKPFERLHGKGEYQGTGMGLAICRKIVRRHGGELTAESSPREGATFIATLPSQRETSVALDQI